MAIFSWTMTIILFVLKYCKCSGYFEIQLVGVENMRGELGDGTCCESRDSSKVNGTCAGKCETFVRVCLKQYQSPVQMTGSCTFGNHTTDVLGGNSFRFEENDDKKATIQLPFQFSWTVIFITLYTFY